MIINWQDMDSLIKPDGSLDKEKISWLDQAQTNALIEKLQLNCQQLKVANSILQGKIHGLNIALNQSAKAALMTGGI